ncbi:MAG TPA: flagellar biosynthesis protein FliQ [Myxococcota bacterium]|jgi:flagellar biosynthetic protein FliQ|nr:flagellar biosynthesis protein FliQ [Myxococcota bacterium]
MTVEQVGDLLRQTIWLALVVAAPLLFVALAVGLAISILQAATQVNEQTLTFVPKIVAVLGTFALLFPWIMRHVVDFGTQLLSNTALRGGP